MIDLRIDFKFLVCLPLEAAWHIHKLCILVSIKVLYMILLNVIITLSLFVHKVGVINSPAYLSNLWLIALGLHEVGISRLFKHFRISLPYLFSAPVHVHHDGTVFVIGHLYAYLCYLFCQFRVRCNIIKRDFCLFVLMAWGSVLLEIKTCVALCFKRLVGLLSIHPIIAQPICNWCWQLCWNSVTLPRTGKVLLIGDPIGFCTD
jgi:hypothetical protein